MLRVIAVPLLVLSTVLMPENPPGVQQRPAAAQQPPEDPAVKRDGWWIRLEKGSKAETITWHFAAPAAEGGNAAGSPAAPEPATATWQRANHPDTLDLPEGVRLSRALNVTATSKPGNVRASFCLFYAANGVQLVEFSGSVKRTVDARARDKRCTP